ncbi:MAG: long-chain fatty acid--CoA ligase [Planctomycetota bacterium]
MMQDEPLSIASVLEHAARIHGRVEVVSRCPEDGSVHRYTYKDALTRTKRLANALQSLGVSRGDRVATMAWNSHRHLEAWYAISGIGAICHTVNPRLFEQQIVYILNHARDSVLMIDVDFLPLLESIWPQLQTVIHIVILAGPDHMPATTLPNVECYEQIVAEQADAFDWPTFDETTPSSLCYTSGTTGDPKGVQYTHRSNLLHAYAINTGEAMCVSGRDVVLMTVPMFHANSWGLAFSCPMAGAKLVLPGSKLDGASIHDWIEKERVTFSAAVPTLWNMLLSHLDDQGGTIESLKEVLIGGTAVPRSMIQTFQDRYDVQVVHAWGMTEVNPTGTMCRLANYMHSWSDEAKLDIQVKQGKPVFGVSLKIVDDELNELPHDGTTMGRLLIKGQWVVRRYYRSNIDAVDSEGWLDTGDIATIDPDGYMQITDRAKDLVKSGGEWISSVELENIANSHHEVELAAVIGVPDEKWQERPHLIIKCVPGSELGREEILSVFLDRVAKWWIPEHVSFVEELPLNAAGKINKKRLRELYQSFSANRSVTPRSLN